MVGYRNDQTLSALGLSSFTRLLDRLVAEFWQGAKVEPRA
jgi:hypothetical protein